MKAPAGAPVTALEKVAEVPDKFPVKVSEVVDNVPLNVLLPAIVCVPVVKTPPFVASAAARVKVVPLIVAPAALAVVVMDPTEIEVHVAFPLASLVKTFPAVGDPPVTLKLPVTVDVEVKFPVKTKLVELSVPLNVLSPAMVCVPVVKTPGDDELAAARIKLLLLTVAPVVA